MSKTNSPYQDILAAFERIEASMLKFTQILIEVKHTIAIAEAANAAQAAPLPPLTLNDAQFLYSADDKTELAWVYRRNINGDVRGTTYYAFSPRALNCLELADLNVYDNFRRFDTLDEALIEEARIRDLLNQSSQRNYGQGGDGTFPYLG